MKLRANVLATQRERALLPASLFRLVEARLIGGVRRCFDERMFNQARPSRVLATLSRQWLGNLG